MSTNTANVGLWAVRDDFEGELQAQLGTVNEPYEENPVEQLPKDAEFYLNQISSFAKQHIVDSPEELFEELPRYDPILLATFVINEEGEVLSHTEEL